jgi:hypothetical protein
MLFCGSKKNAPIPCWGMSNKHVVRVQCTSVWHSGNAMVILNKNPLNRKILTLGKTMQNSIVWFFNDGPKKGLTRKQRKQWARYWCRFLFRNGK